MTKKHSTKKALIASVLSLALCFSMLVGTTYAWFTDVVTSSNNIIKTGILDAVVTWTDDLKADEGSWYDVQAADAKPVFDYELWEPGYVAARYLKVKNNGTLAFKYKVQIIAKGTLADENDVKLSDVIDVYYAPEQVDVPNRDLDNNAKLTKIGTLSEFIAGSAAINDVLLAGESDYATVVLKMQESAGNEYQNLSVATSFDIMLFATQYTYEKDSFDDQYDKDAKYPAVDTVTVPVDGITLDQTDLTIEMGKTATLIATVSPESATNKTVTWTSSDESVATVDENGVVIGVAPGTATIYATAGEFSASCVVTVFKDYVKKLNAGHNINSSISVSTGSDFLPIVAVNPEIYGFSVFNEDTRIVNAVHFRFARVEKQTIDENSYKVLVDLAVKDESGNDLELKPGMPSSINGKEYLHVYMNLIEVPEGYSISEVKVNGSTFTLTNNASGNPAAGEYWIGFDAKDLYLQSKEAGLIEVTLTKTN